MARLAGKVAIVTGGGTGIGRAGAVRFAEEGARVVIADKSADSGTAAANFIKKNGGDSVFVETDVSQQDQVDNLFQTVTRTYGKLNILYNNAGGPPADERIITDTSVEEFWRVISVDLFGTWICCKLGIPLLRQTEGCIINTSSSVALVARAKLSSYSAAKGGVAALTRQLALDLAQYKIRVNAIAPGVTFTERVSKKFTAMPNYTGEENLLGVVQPIEIAHLAVYLASDEARATTGQVIPVDSGLTIS